MMASAVRVAMPFACGSNRLTNRSQAFPAAGMIRTCLVNNCLISGSMRSHSFTFWASAFSYNFLGPGVGLLPPASAPVDLMHGRRDSNSRSVIQDRLSATRKGIEIVHDNESA